MSESVHAVVAKPSQGHDHQHHHHHQQNRPAENHCNALIEEDEQEDDDDDDIDIIGKFGSNTSNTSTRVSNPMSFVMTAASTSVGSNSYLLSTAPFPSISVPVNQGFRLMDNNVPLTLTSSARSNLFDPGTAPDDQNTANRIFSSQEFSPKRENNQRGSQQNQPSASTHYDAQLAQEWATEGNLTPARDRLRRALRYYFMSPMEKWRIKSRFPWKLLFQVIKIILVTSQLILFGNTVTSYKAADSSMLVSLHNLFLLNWDSSRDFKVVPPESGPYAVYTKDDVYRHIDYAIQNYANISALTVGSFGYQIKREAGDKLTNSSHVPDLPTESMSHINACYRRYTNATLNPSLGEYYIDAAITEKCIIVDVDYPPGSKQWSNFSFYQYLLKNDPDLNNFESLLQLQLKLPLRTILLNTIVAFNTPQCFDLDVNINFDNRAHSGEIMVYMANHNRQIDCFGNLEDHSKETHSHNVHIVINCVVLLLCTFSLVLCIRSLWRGQALRRRTVRFFALAYRRNLESQSSLHFIDGWIFMILLNDCLLITGTTINLLRQLYVIGPHKFSLRPIDFDNLCSALLGVGNLLVWCGLLRYLAFFSKYNILIVTLKHALARVLRFLFCVFILYGGFCFSGWIILGPYHWKFQTLARTSECLFALMNGDDVFATFAYLQSSSLFVWWFSRVYLYTFVMLFIYVVLSLFIAILMDSYETIKDYNINRKRKIKGDLLFSNDQLARFIASSPIDDDEDDWTASYRINLLNDEEVEFQNTTTARERQRLASGTSGVANYHCCLCHCWQHFATPITCIRNAFASLRGKLSNPRDESSEESDVLPIN